MYGGLDTIKSYFRLLLHLSISEILKLERLSRLRFFEFNFAISIAPEEISIPTPSERGSSFRIVKSIQPDPVPMSKIFIFLFL